jgi:hypothetical protein
MFLGFLASKLDMVIIANGTPPHFFKKISDTSENCEGHSPLEPKILP